MDLERNPLFSSGIEVFLGLIHCRILFYADNFLLSDHIGEFSS